MARDVNILFSNARTTGTNVSIAQRAVDLTVTWKDDAGQAHTDTTTELFPNILAELSAAELRTLGVALSLAIKRRRLGLDADLQVNT